MSHIDTMKLFGCALFVSAFACPLGYADAQTGQAALAPEITQSIALRARYHIPTPLGEGVIYIDSVSVHHTREESSTVAARGPDGRWRVSTVSEEGPGLVNVAQHLTSKDERTLSEVEGRQLDGLLGQAVQDHAKPDTPPNLEVGAVFHTMEINTSSAHTLIRWVGRLTGTAGAIADLLIGAG